MSHLTLIHSSPMTLVFVSSASVVSALVQMRPEDMLFLLRENGARVYVKVPFGEGWENSLCESCGNCAQACPTGALTIKRRKIIVNGKLRKSAQPVRTVLQAVRWICT